MFNANLVKTQRAFMNNRTLYIGNLGTQISEEQLFDAFKGFGKIDALWIDHSRANTSPRGYTFGFVSYKRRDTAADVLKLDEPIEVMGRAVRVSKRKLKIRPMQYPPQHSRHSSLSSTISSPTSLQSDQLKVDPAKTDSVPLDIPQQKQTLVPQIQNQQELAIDYNKNGMLRIRDDPLGYVVRVSGISATWDASNLFYFLANAHLCVCATLIYNDFDERGLRQGLAQFISKTTAEEMCRWGSVEVQGISLDLDPCDINSIGPVRRTYAGAYTAFNPHDYDAVTPELEAGDIALSPIGLDSQIPMDPQLFTPVSEVFTPATQASPSSPLGQKKNIPVTVDIQNENSPPLEYQTIAADPSPQIPQNTSSSPLSRVRVPLQTIAETNRTAVFNPMVPMPLPLRASQTVVIDNIDSRIMHNARVVHGLATKYGDVVEIDVIKLGPTKYRAYVSFETPHQAVEATKQLHMYTSGAYTLSTHLA